MNGPKVLTIDIETAPILAAVWQTFKANVGLDQIETDWFILSFSAKWLHKDAVIYDDQSQQVAKGLDLEDDTRLLRKLHTLLDEADIVIAHNGIKFDVRKINARFILNGFPPPSPYKVIDTLLASRRSFGFTSHRLLYLTDKLCKSVQKAEHQNFPGYKLWKEVLKGNPAAWEEMREYNIDDVRSLEELYLIMRPWIIGHPNVAAYYEDEEVRCPKCGSKHITYRGTIYTQTGQYRRIKCKTCKGWSRTRYTLNSIEKRKALLTN